MLGSTRWLETRLSGHRASRARVPQRGLGGPRERPLCHDDAGAARSARRSPRARLRSGLGKDAARELGRPFAARLLQRRGALPRVQRDSRRGAGLRPLVRELPHALRHDDVAVALRRPRLPPHGGSRARRRALRRRPRDAPLLPAALPRDLRLREPRDPRDPGTPSGVDQLGAAGGAVALEPDRGLRDGGDRLGRPHARVARAGQRRGTVRPLRLSRARRVRGSRRLVRPRLPALGAVARNGVRGRGTSRDRGRRAPGTTARRPGARAIISLLSFSRAREQLVVAKYLADGGKGRQRPGSAGSRAP